MKRVVLSLLLFGASCLGADLTGKWTGSIDVKQEGETRVIPVLLILRQEGNQLTGTGGGGADDQYPVQKGVVDGDSVILDVAAQEVYHLELKVNGDEMTGNVRKEDGPKMKISVKRSS